MAILDFRKADFNWLKGQFGLVPWLETTKGENSPRGLEYVEKGDSEGTIAKAPMRQKVGKPLRKPARLHKECSVRLRTKTRSKTSLGRKRKEAQLKKQHNKYSLHLQGGRLEG